MGIGWMKQMQKARNKRVEEVVVEEFTGNKRRKTPIKGRSSTTYMNKIERLKREYNKLFKNSEQQKEKDAGTLPRNKKGYFCDKYTNVDGYLKNYKVTLSNAKK